MNTTALPAPAGPVSHARASAYFAADETRLLGLIDDTLANIQHVLAVTADPSAAPSMAAMLAPHITRINQIRALRGAQPLPELRL